MRISKLRPGKQSESVASQRNRLPEAATCDKNLYLPEYTTLDEVHYCLHRFVLSVLGASRIA